jgi:AraC-like DNA-binding protein
VLYFSQAFFSLGGQEYSMPDFLSQSFGTHMILPPNAYQELLDLLKKAESIANSKKPYTELLLKSILVEFFYRLDTLGQNIQIGKDLPGHAGEIKRYIDEKYATITSVEDIATQFFYTREHLSRKFKQAFGISVAEYLTRRRIMESLWLLEKTSIAEAAYAVGFRSQSAFISPFKNIMHCLPSEFKARNKRL